eukprot:57123-Pyramimonas_sp.AAC.1
MTDCLQSPEPGCRPAGDAPLALHACAGLPSCARRCKNFGAGALCPKGRSSSRPLADQHYVAS